MSSDPLAWQAFSRSDSSIDYQHSCVGRICREAPRWALVWIMALQAHRGPRGEAGPHPLGPAGQGTDLSAAVACPWEDHSRGGVPVM